MKIIELSEVQFRNYSKLHSNRNYKQTIEYANMKKNYSKLYLGFFDESNSNLMGATLLLEKNVYNHKIGIIPGSFLIDYNNDTLFKDFITYLKDYLKSRKFVYLKVENKVPYKIFNKDGVVNYFDTNIIKLFDDLNFVRSNKNHYMQVILKAEDTPDNTYKLFNSNTKRNINLALERAISIYKDESNDINNIFNLNNNSNKKEVENIINSFNTDNNKVEIYTAKLNPEKYVNNYRYLLKEEDVNNDKLNSMMKDFSIKKTDTLINKKMESDKLVNKYNSEIVKATNLLMKYPNEILVGSVLILRNNREIYFLDEGYNKELNEFYTSHILKWEIIKKYINEGYNIFNFGSIKNMDKNNNSYLFKIGFGGNVYEYIGYYDLIINKWLYKVFKFIEIFEEIKNKYFKKNKLD